MFTALTIYLWMKIMTEGKDLIVAGVGLIVASCLMAVAQDALVIKVLWRTIKCLRR